jgi:hypothetical protein
MKSLLLLRTSYSEPGYAQSTTSWMALTMSASTVKGSLEHPKQSYNVGRNFVVQAARVNSGKPERSDVADIGTTGDASTAVALRAAVMALYICSDLACKAFMSRFLTVVGAPFSCLTGAEGAAPLSLSLESLLSLSI